MISHELHIDLLRCEFCSQHNKLLLFCSACGRARSRVIITPLYAHRGDRPSTQRCRFCYTQFSKGVCRYCVPQPTKTRKRIIVERYVDGFIRDVYMDTGEVVPLAVRPQAIPKKAPYRKRGPKRPHITNPNPVGTQEYEDAEWNRIRRERSARQGKKASSYTYGKGLATNLAAPEIVRLRSLHL